MGCNTSTLACRDWRRVSHRLITEPMAERFTNLADCCLNVLARQGGNTNRPNASSSYPMEGTSTFTSTARRVPHGLRSKKPLILRFHFYFCSEEEICGGIFLESKSRRTSLRL